MKPIFKIGVHDYTDYVETLKPTANDIDKDGAGRNLLNGLMYRKKIGTKGKWYDHKVSVSNPVKTEADGEYTMEVTMTGGSGRASIKSPANITVEKGKYTAEIVWSSSHYEYMTVDGVQYDPVNTEGNSTFLIPVTPDTDITVQALTTAMSEPHLIEYVLHFDSVSLTAK